MILLVCTTGKTSNMTVQRSSDKISLAPCPKTPNCVSSMVPTDNNHYISPLVYIGDKKVAYQKLVVIIESYPLARIEATGKDYIFAEFRSKIFDFVDDVEFLFSLDESVIDVRSASRVGNYDFGKNRRRIEDIRKRLNQALNH